MSWRFPKFPTATNSVPDVDDTNANFYEVVEEIGGRLNEHNFASGSFTKGQVSPEAGFVYHSNSKNSGNTDNPATAGNDIRIGQHLG